MVRYAIEPTQRGLFTDQDARLLQALDEHGAVALRNRKYLGSKVRLLDFIEREIRLAAGGIESFLDGFAGTGVVADRMRAHTGRLTLIDNLASNYAINRTFFASHEDNVRVDYLAAALRELNRLPPAPGYAAEHYAGRYFTAENAGLIDAIRDQIELRRQAGDCSEQERHVLVASLLFAADKAANTVGQYDAYLRNLGAASYDRNGRHLVDANVYRRLRLRMPAFRLSSDGATVLQADLNAVAGDHPADVVYLDPPYAERQYVDCYHVLENIASWKKPALSGKTKKFERAALKSEYSRRGTALAAFEQLLGRIRARIIAVSYSNEGIIPLDRLRAALAARGATTVSSRAYPVFGNGAGRSVRRPVAEYLAICRVDAH